MRLNTVRALQMMDLPLCQIKEVLEYDDLGKIVDFLSRAERKADEKIAALQYSKSKIQLAKADYEKKLREKQFRSGSFIQEFPASFCSRIPWKHRPLTISGIISATFTTGFPHP